MSNAVKDSATTSSNNHQTGDTIYRTKKTENKKIIRNYSDKLRGIWTDGSSENATFDIGKDSIYYVDQFASFKYALTGDTIKIKYPEWTFVGHINFLKDTLVIKSEDGLTKYWKFKD